MKYFTIHELSTSPTALRLGIRNTPSEAVEQALILLVKDILDPLREAWGAPIIVSSGYRSQRLNSVVGGAKNSQHIYGQAADIHTVSDLPDDNRRLRDLVIRLGLPFDQLIDEFACNWLHVSHKATGNRRQILSATRKSGKTVYTLGIKK